MRIITGSPRIIIPKEIPVCKKHSCVFAEGTRFNPGVNTIFELLQEEGDAWVIRLYRMECMCNVPKPPHKFYMTIFAFMEISEISKGSSKINTPSLEDMKRLVNLHERLLGEGK